MNERIAFALSYLALLAAFAILFVRMRGLESQLEAAVDRSRELSLQVTTYSNEVKALTSELLEGSEQSDETEAGRPTVKRHETSRSSQAAAEIRGTWQLRRHIIPNEEQNDDNGTAWRMTPAPPPPPYVNTWVLEKGVEWPSSDKNYGFESDQRLPLLGVVTLNAQTTKPGSKLRGLHPKSSWMHTMSFHNKHQYCKKWDYDLIVEDNSIVEPKRDVAWSKIPIFKKWLPKYQWLMWVDMDAFFMRFDLPMHELLTNDKDIIIAKDWHGINMGVFFIRNSPYSFDFIEKMWNAPRNWWVPWEEQSAMMAMTNVQKNPKEARKHLQHFYFPAQRKMNSYAEQFAYGNLKALYRPGDRIVHFPNCKAFKNCRQTITKYYRKMLRENGLEDILGTAPDSLFPELRE